MWRAIAALLAVIGSDAAPLQATSSGVKPFKIDLTGEASRMLELVKATRLPNKPVYPTVGASAGIDLDVLKQLQREWIHGFSWKGEQKELNKYHHFTTDLEGLNIHFIHERSRDPNAIPLLLLHGWPGSFLEFVPLIESLTQQSKTSNGDPVSFNIVIPSLPGFAFSTAPKENWTIADTARIFNSLMTDLLGYEKFAVHGTDWGSGVGYSMYEQFNSTVRALHAPFLPFFPLTEEQLEAANVTLSPMEQFQVQRGDDWYATGNGYFIEQSTKPNTIGLALEDNPVGQLAWIGEKMIEWSDPRAGTPPSVLNHQEILRSTALYFLTKSFTSSAFIYFQNPGGFRSDYVQPPTDAPLLFSSFKYNVGFWPAQMVRRVGNLVYYQSHEFGGHFPGIDNPPALLTDIREIGRFWA
ncbi:Alpha/Beta hydrolase protein [Stachybotrys elegans]|uniref:Alpha/Beta hydrolase protein n=1 Tax=Stachybotrys elegans TaxID=80388 RepID=A0A8K0WMJ3_9HYPO|nr:Alpha/Beta hydrolase protein [Stachybotrys elegans]